MFSRLAQTVMIQLKKIRWRAHRFHGTFEYVFVSYRIAFKSRSHPVQNRAFLFFFLSLFFFSRTHPGVTDLLSAPLLCTCKKGFDVFYRWWRISDRRREGQKSSWVSRWWRNCWRLAGNSCRFTRRHKQLSSWCESSRTFRSVTPNPTVQLGRERNSALRRFQRLWNDTAIKIKLLFFHFPLKKTVCMVCIFRPECFPNDSDYKLPVNRFWGSTRPSDSSPRASQ